MSDTQVAAQTREEKRPDDGRLTGAARAVSDWWGWLTEGIGGPARRGVLVLLAVAALLAGAVWEALHPANWRRRTVRAELRRSLRQALAGSLGTVLITGALVGFGMVYQALTWLSFAGQEGFSGSLLVTVLLREVAPLVIGLTLLGRSGTVTIVEFGEIKAAGQLRLLEAQGIDPFQLLVLPRTVAFAIAGFVLGVIFVATALATGFVVADMFNRVQGSSAQFLNYLLSATDKRDFLLFPAKLVLIGALVALVSALTGFSSTPQEKPAHLLPRGFVRGTLAVLASSVLLTLAVA